MIAAEELIDFKFSATEQTVAKGPVAKGGTPTGQNQYHLPAINIENAWLRAGGWGFVGLADSGLMMEHPDLRAFTTDANSIVSHVPGGNFLSAASFDVSNLPQSAGPNIDERKGVPSPAEACDLLDGTDDNLMRLSFAGHGTHTSGLVGANVRNNNFIEGVCRNCGIGMWKINTPLCQVDASNVGFVSSDIGPAAIPNAITFLTDIGAQAINLSFGQQVTTPDAFCAGQPNSAYCIALDVARENDVALVASSGNNRRSPQFPARDLRTIAVGGTDPIGAFWDRLADPFGFCPFPQSEVECGSNFSEFNTDRRQEFAVPAVEVRSTMYVGQNWNADLGCGDSIGDELPANGVGLCTGTSMSAPIVSGIIGLLRSINPLVPIGVADVFGARTIRSALIGTTNRAQQTLPWDNRFGYGIPDTAAAADSILGRVRGSVVRNRAIPLFGFYGDAAKDYAAVATPQHAMALARNTTGSYLSVSPNIIEGEAIPGYANFPVQIGSTPQPPRARAYILSTEFSPFPGAQLISLHLMERTRRFPISCIPTAPGCNPNNRDFILITEADIGAQNTAGYNLLAPQGYIFSAPAPGTSALYLQCKPSDDDCAVFTFEQKSAFEVSGYIQNLPGRSSNILGYAYNTVDTDEDGLPDGFERVVGTNRLVPDSDGDGPSDATEFPMVGMAFSDPCSGIAPQCDSPQDNLFANGFEN